MSHEKKYNDALERARDFHDGPTANVVTRTFLEQIFPELRESEDERIRRRLIDFISSIKAISESGRNSWAVRKDDAEMCNAFLAYLKKQKDHFRDDTKMVELQDYSGLNDLERVIHRGFLSAGVENVPVTIIKETAQECFAQMKPAESEEDEKVLSQAIETLEHENYSILAEKLKSFRLQPHSWSKEDRRMLDIIISELEQEGENVNVPGLYHLEIDWLKSLRPKPHWKPSEEQMNCLCAAVDAAIRKHNESVSGYKPARVLKSLYEDLQKLEEQEEPEYYQHFDPDC